MTDSAQHDPRTPESPQSSESSQSSESVESSEAQGPGPAASGQSAPKRGSAGLAALAGQNFSLERSIGGVQGVLESVLPITLFSVVYGVSRDLVLSCVVALVPSVGFSIWRLIRREPPTQALSGVLGVGLGAFLALRTGQSENFFLPSILKNTAYAVALAVSNLVRWPLIGIGLGFVLGEQTAWRRNRPRLRAYTQVTWLWCALFTIRLAVQIPLYLLGMTAVLGLMSVPLGLPLFGITVYLSWLILRRVPTVHEHDDDPAPDQPDAGSPRATNASG